jgi:hypothetical protein
MNFALNVSIKTERLLQKYIEEATTQEKGEVGWISAEEEEELYKRALGEVLAADSRAKADGNIRLGEIILIVDSDTRVVSHSYYIELSIQVYANNVSSLRTALCTVLLRCSCLQRLRLSSIRQV